MSTLNCDEALVILQEECGEVIQIISKIHRYGLHGYNPITKEYNDELLHKEIGDLLCMIDLCIKHNILKEADLEFYKEQKREKLKKWSNL
jgi:NTP pyrophosphatase (non-canonical NTP hydrolase)